MHFRKTAPAVVLGAGVVLCIIGCSREHAGTVVLRVTSTGATATGGPVLIPAANGHPALIALGPDTVLLQHAQFVVKGALLEPASTGECDPEEEEEQGEAPCAELAPRPIVIDLPLDRADSTILTARALAGAYSTLQLQIHPPAADEDRNFLGAHPELAGASVRVGGTYSRRGARRDFTYVSAFNEAQELVFAPPLTVAAGDTTYLKLDVALATWFLNADRNGLIDPATANADGPNAVLVRDHLRLSLGVSGSGP